MAWLFVNEDEINLNTYTITGEDAKHIKKALRMKCGEEITLCDKNCRQYYTIISGFSENGVEVEVQEQFLCLNEPSAKVTLYQALPKADKMDMIVQKCVELGVSRIVPVITSRTISRPDGKSAIRKAERYQKIAKSAAEQSRRGIIPEISEIKSFEEALQELDKLSNIIVFYEMGGENLGKLIDKDKESISIFIGSEGGFAPEEIEQIKNAGGKCATLGKRILRAETAPVTAMSLIMYLTGNLD